MVWEGGWGLVMVFKKNYSIYQTVFEPSLSSRKLLETVFTYSQIWRK
jgi:hypothetical protein